MAVNCWSVFWFFGLLIVGWPLAGLVMGVYLLCLPFTVCIEPCKEVCKILFDIVQLPVWFTKNMVEGKQCSSS